MKYSTPPQQGAPGSKMSDSGTPDLTGLIRPGDTVLWGQSHAEPVTLIRALVAQRNRIGRIRLFLGIGLAEVLLPEHADAFDFLAYCGSGANRKLIKAGG